MQDSISIKTKDGTIYDDVMASVQNNKIYTTRYDIPISPGDEITRQTSAGKDELFIVEDPGFRKGLGGIPDNYQIRVRRADQEISRSGNVVYNVTGDNTRFNLNGVDSSINIINQNPSELFQVLRNEIESKVKDEADREKLLIYSQQLEQGIGKEGFAAKYAKFVEVAAKHMAILSPFMPALTQLLVQS